MCRFKSGIILKDRVFVPDYDSHTDMLAELGIEDTEKNAKTKFVRAELYPENGDVFTPIDRWKFNTDQDILPDWYIEEADKVRAMAAVKEWAKNRIHIGKENLVINSGECHYIKDCKNVIIKDNAKVLQIIDTDIEYICGNAEVGCIYGDATLISSLTVPWKSKNKMNVLGNAMFKDSFDKVIYQAGKWRLVNVGDSGRIG